MTDADEHPLIHPTADVDERASVGAGTRIWHQAQVMPNAAIGTNCILGKGVFVDSGVTIGDRCKLQNYAQIYRGSQLGSDVFIGPHVVLANDRYPRASTPEGTRKGDQDWSQEGVLIHDGASIGASSVLAPGIVVGRSAMVGAGAVVTRDVPPHALVVGNPARQIGQVCTCGHRVDGEPPRCTACGQAYQRLADGLAQEG